MPLAVRTNQKQTVLDIARLIIQNQGKKVTVDSKVKGSQSITPSVLGVVKGGTSNF